MHNTNKVLKLLILGLTISYSSNLEAKKKEKDNGYFFELFTLGANQNKDESKIAQLRKILEITAHKMQVRIRSFASTLKNSLAKNYKYIQKNYETEAETTARVALRSAAFHELIMEAFHESSPRILIALLPLEPILNYLIKNGYLTMPSFYKQSVMKLVSASSRFALSFSLLNHYFNSHSSASSFFSHSSASRKDMLMSIIVLAEFFEAMNDLVEHSES